MLTSAFSGSTLLAAVLVAWWVDRQALAHMLAWAICWADWAND